MKTDRFCLTFIGTLLFCSFAWSEEIPRPEHPRPQRVRSEWINLNGEWEYAETRDNEESFLEEEEYPETILVPFCRESELSGIGRTGFMENVWYRRTFQVPSDWEAERIRLHVNASDWLTRVWVNGTYMGGHEGGYSPFAFDVTEALGAGENTVVIHAFDDSASGLQPLGKQSIREESYSIFYTRTTGIWQTVWLEGVGSSFVSDFSITPDPDHSRILLQTAIDGRSRGLEIQAVAYANGKKVGEARQKADWRNDYFVLDLSEKHLWSVEDPFLYDLKLRLLDGDRIMDEVDSYFGLRKVTIEGRSILINDEPVFQRLVLDQGFYPDGIWTAPTDEALKQDIEMAKAAGFNGARLHQKVFEPRFLYWADKLGYLLWDEFPSYGADYSNPEVNRPFIQSWNEIVLRDRNHPSVIGWCPFNETPQSAGELQITVLEMTRSIDPTRPVIETSGWTHSHPDPEVMDAHDYNQDIESFRERWEQAMKSVSLPERYGGIENVNIPFFISEFGGIGWYEDQQEESWGYGDHPQSKEEFYERFEGLVNALLDNRYMFGYCYTQLTDIEQEKNGVFTYDRSEKFDAERLHQIQTRTAAYEKNPPLKITEEKVTFEVLLGGAPDGLFDWKYTTEEPGEGWNTPDFDEGSWKTGKGAFGQKGGVEEFIHTRWTSKDIWLRRTFEYEGQDFNQAILAMHYDNETTVYINGKQIWHRTGWNDRYEGFSVTDELKEALQEGENVIAIHCHQDDGGQFIDAAILIETK